MQRRIFGIENEYGVTCTLRGQRRLSPDEVARYLFRRVVSWGRSSNVFLANGARLYLDVGSHPEYATPECDSVRELVVHDKAGERILEQLLTSAEQRLGDEGVHGDVYLFKNNTDSAGNSYGCHENYCTSRRDDFSSYTEVLIPFLVSRQIYAGAGKVLQTARGARYCVSQRAEHIWEGVSSATTRSRPIINTRDEPHADARKYRRLHVIVGDANPSQVATFLKVGTTALVLAMVEDDLIPHDFEFASPVASMRHVSHDLTLREGLPLADGSTITALEVQWELLDLAKEYVDRHGTDSTGGEATHEVLRRWEQVLAGLERDPMELADQLDWVAKFRLLEGYRERHGLAWSDAKLRAMDIQYSDMRPHKGLAWRVGLEQLVSDAEAIAAISEPPADTRAYFRGRCIDTFPEQVVAANWDSLVFDVGSDALRRVPMMEPMRGTRAHVGTLFDECESAAELLRRLGT
ncbi:MAG TPA: Pup--protein ligase [Acidimicrobiaceae bacterium]|nr:Pup--protein ligase [Acidimicrobiaceae bacterium]